MTKQHMERPRNSGNRSVQLQDCTIQVRSVACLPSLVIASCFRKHNRLLCVFEPKPISGSTQVSIGHSTLTPTVTTSWLRMRVGEELKSHFPERHQEQNSALAPVGSVFHRAWLRYACLHQQVYPLKSSSPEVMIYLDKQLFTKSCIHIASLQPKCHL